eukprot:jgi/Tetstr1/435975/TSEL_024856.t1
MARRYADLQEELRVLTYNPITINTSTQRRKRRRGAQAATTAVEHSNEADSEADRQEGGQAIAIPLENEDTTRREFDARPGNLVVMDNTADNPDAYREEGLLGDWENKCLVAYVRHTEITYELARLRAALNVHKLDVDNKRRWFNDHRFNAYEKNGGAAERPDLLELAQSGRVGAKSVSDEDDYLAVPELLQRAESGYEAVRPVSRVPGLFPLSTDLTNEYLKQDDRRLPAQEEYLWMSCFGAHMAALFVALDELLPYVPAANQDFTPYLARARNHAEAIDKAFRFRLAFLRRLNEVKRVHAPKQPLLPGWRQQLRIADVDEDVAVDAGVAAKVSTSDGVGRLWSELLELCEATFRLSQFAEFCHDSENISPLEATTAIVVRYVAWIGERGHIGAKSMQPYLSAINTFFELHNLDPIAKDSLHLTSARRGLMLRQRRLETAPLRAPLPADVAYRFVTKAELIVSAPTPEYQHDFRALVASVVNFMFFARGLTGVSCRVRDVHVDNYNITLQVYREKGRAGRRGRNDLRVLLLPVAEHPRVARLLHHFIDTVQSVPLVTVALAETNFWAVTPSEQSKPRTAATMSDWLSTAVRLVGAAPPAGTSWTTHSLRKGAASAANAIGVPLSHIRSQGGWTTNSDVVLDYIDPNVLPSPGAWFFFGHIAPLRHFQVQQDSAAVAFPVPPT